MKTVLIFAYYWPPAGGVAVQRFLKFTKYLPQFGWMPIVVAPQNGSYQYLDETLSREISPETEVHLTDTFEPFELYNLLQGKKGKSTQLAVGTGSSKKSFTQKISEYIRANYFIPDARKGWVKYAVKEGERIIAAQKIDAIITTSPPHSAQLIGLELKKKYKLPWIADFRDPWTTILYNKFLPRTKSTIQKDEALEAEVLRNADVVTLISNGMNEEFSIPVTNAKIITNGFDEDDYLEKPIETEGCFTLRYVGNFLAVENPPGLWRALRTLLDTNKEFAKYFRFELTGQIAPTITEQIETHQLNKWFINNSFVTHKKAIQLMQGANILLLVFSNVPGNKSHMTGKMFEYIPTQNPILSFGNTSGDASQLLTQISREPVLDYEDETSAKAFIEKYFNLWLENKKRFQYSDNKHLSLSRKSLAKELADTLNSISS